MLCVIIAWRCGEEEGAEPRDNKVIFAQIVVNNSDNPDEWLTN